MKFGHKIIGIVFTVVLLAGIFLTASRAVGGKSAPLHTALDAYLQELGYASLPLQRDKHSNNLLGEGKIAGKNWTFMLDSGCSISRVGKPLAKKLKTIGQLDVELEDEYLGRLTDPEFMLLESIKLGGATFSNQPALPLRLVLGNHNANFDLIIGCDFLLRNACLIDCLDGRLYCCGERPPIATQSSLDETLRQSGYYEVKIQTGEDIIMSCDVEINGVPVPMAVDTGANITGIDDGVAKRLGLNLKSRGMEMSGLDEIGTHEMKLARVDTFKVGGLTVNRLPLGVTKFEYWRLAENSNTNRVLQGLLGADFLGENQALIDFRHKRMWLRPPETKSKP